MGVASFQGIVEGNHRLIAMPPSDTDAGDRSCCPYAQRQTRISGSRLNREQGQGLVEYALILATVAVVLIISMLFLGGKIEELFYGTDGPVFRPPATACDASYSGACIPPPPPDLDCDDLRGMGIQGEVKVVGSDPHGLDPDGDGIACT